MSYTPHEWQNDELITAAKMNNIEEGIAEGGGGGSAIVSLSAEAYSSASRVFGWFTYAVYNDSLNRWEFFSGNWTDNIQSIMIFGYDVPDVLKTAPIAIPAVNDMCLVYVPSAQSSPCAIEVTGDIDSTSTAIYAAGGAGGSASLGYIVRGNGSIKQTAIV